MLDWFAVSRRDHPRPPASLADPLEGEDWHGHQWAAVLISRIMRHRRSQTARHAETCRTVDITTFRPARRSSRDRRGYTS